MDIQQLNAIGKDIAHTVRNRLGFDDITFHTGTQVHTRHTSWRSASSVSVV
jgi:hypothetical protein